MIKQSWQDRLIKRRQQGLYRQRQIIKSQEQNAIYVTGNTCIDFSRNDYLGLNQHGDIARAVVVASEEFGLGSGGSGFISGYSTLHQEVAIELAQWLGVEKVIFFSSGYCANIGVLSALSQRHDLILADKYCHTSLLDGMILSRSKFRRYQHNALWHAQQLAAKYKPNLLVTESVFSMTGKLAPLARLAQLAAQYNAGMVIDDAHGLGVLGDTGRGALTQLTADNHSIICLVASLGKAFNMTGALVGGDKLTIDTVLQFARSYCYSTELSPILCAALLKTLEIIKTQTWRRQQLNHNIVHMMDYAKNRGLILSNSALTPIKSIYIRGDVLSLQARLMTKGLYVAAIRPPSVPKGESCLRISLNCLHTTAQINYLIDTILSELDYVT